SRMKDNRAGGFVKLDAVIAAAPRAIDLDEPCCKRAEKAWTDTREVGTGHTTAPAADDGSFHGLYPWAFPLTSITWSNRRASRATSCTDYSKQRARGGRHAWLSG